MFNEDQIVQVKWNNTNREWFESKGYVYTKRYDSFDVPLKYLNFTSKQRVFAVCDYCNNEYETSFAVLMSGRKIVQKDCCPDCAGKKASDVSKKKRAAKYIGLAKEICENRGYILLTTVDEYIDVKMNIRFICPMHGEQIMMLDNLIHGHGCKPCSYEKRGANLKYDIEYVKECVESINGNKWLNPKEYKDTFTRNLNILCSCGSIFTTSFSNYTKRNVTTCYSCSCKESSGEERIRKFLENNEIDFVREKRFDDCRDIRPLPFDFYLPQINLVIEFDGQQHFEDVGRGNYEITQKHDQIKNQYCKDNSIDLLRIPYWEGNNIETIIMEKLNL